MWQEPPLENGEELVEYATNPSSEPKFLELYTSINDDEIGTIRTIFIDFDLTKEEYIKKELTEEIIVSFLESQNNSKSFDATNQEINEFITQLSDQDINELHKHIKDCENDLISNMNESGIQEHYLSKIKNGYLKEPFEEAKKVAEYLNEFNIKTILNWSGSKGVHLRIPLDEIHFDYNELNHDPKLFLNSFAGSLESIALDKKIKTSTIDYNVLNKNRGLQRLPCSKHNVSHLHSNFINPLWDYDEAIKCLESEEPEYIPQIVNKSENTINFLNSNIVKEAIITAIHNKDNFDNESANPYYKLNSDSGKLTEMIGKVYVEGYRNEIGYRIVHLLRRSGFTKEQVENIFKSFHDSNKDYKNTIYGSIKSAYDKDIKQLCGLKHLINGIRGLEGIQDKSKVIKYFRNSFGYYDKPTETTLDPFKLGEEEITVKLFENAIDKWFVFENIYDGINLNIDFKTKIGGFENVETSEEFATFKFKFENQFFELKKGEPNIVKELLKEEEVELPKLFFEYLKKYFRNIDKDYLEVKKLTPTHEIYELFTNPSGNIRYARRKLGHFLKEKGMILRKNINNPYILDKESNGYNSIEIDDILMLLDENIFNHEDVIHTDDVIEALGFIADRRTPVYNIVKFPNCLYDISNFEVLKPTDEPIFTLTEVKYNYNPEAKGEKIQEFLKSSLHKEDENKSDEEEVTAFLEMIGYLLTSGNKLNAFFIIAGIGGSGKGVATNLITHIFGTDKVGGLLLQELTPDNRFATAHLENKQVNIVRDSPEKPIDDTGLLKQITGYDDIPVEPKGKNKYMIPKEEVPDMILVCNNMPKFKNGFEEAIVQRVVLFEFLNRFRGTKKVNLNLEEEILAEPDNMEWLIYNGIKAYKSMIQSDAKKIDFKARVDEKTTRNLLGKHTNPIPYILPMLVKTTEEYIPEKDAIIAKELNELIVFVAKKKGLSINKIDDHGHIPPRFLVESIREYFEFENWKSGPRTIEGESVRVYPNLYKHEDYANWLEMKKKEEEEDENNPN